MKPKEFFAAQREKPGPGYYVVTFDDAPNHDIGPSVILKWIPGACKWYAPDAVHGYLECGYLDRIRPPGFKDEKTMIYVVPLK